MYRSVRKVLFFYILASLSSFSLANEGFSKYKRGDCITPITVSYSWYGKYATVEAYSKIEGLTKEKSYILAFPFSGSNSTIFDKEIELVTKKVIPSLCGE